MISNIISSEFKVIGRNKYHHLKNRLSKVDQESTDDLVKFRKQEKISFAEAQKLVTKYETQHYGPSNNEAQIAYFKKVREPKNAEQKRLGYEELKTEFYKRFKNTYLQLNKTHYYFENEYLENFKPIVYYFLGNFENFIKSKHFVDIENHKPSLDKGLLIVGDYGNGKTSTMEAFSKVLQGTSKSFKIIGTKTAVTKFSFLKDDNYSQKEFYKSLTKQRYLFDDLLKEDKASSFGKINLIEQILEERHRNKVVTHATLNYRQKNDGTIFGNINDAIEQIGEKYGGYMYDRIFSMFNVIEFKGKSLRGRE